MTWLKKKSNVLAVFVALALVVTVLSVVAVRHNINKKRQIAHIEREKLLAKLELDSLMLKNIIITGKMIENTDSIRRLELTIESNAMEQKVVEAKKKMDELNEKLNKLGIKPK
jgi:hypothetical protein